MIAIRDLQKIFHRGGEPVVACDVRALDVERGAHVALIGRSGLGKTTLLHCIAGIARPDRGSIQVGETRVDTLGEAARDRFRAEHVGLVYQTLNLLMPFSALENVALGAVFGRGAHRGTRARAQQLLERVGLADRMGHRPNELSVGQAQRVAICRALINDPELILADEPLGNQDRETGREVLALLLELAAEGNRTVLMVTHDQESAAQMQRTIDLADLRPTAPAAATQGAS
ncbi:MAG: ABC transporter ATP-binding protein [Planctomycetota bacterium]